MQLYWKQTVAQVFCALATAGLGEGAVLVAVCLGVAGGCFSCGAGCWAALLNSVCWNWSGRRISACFSYLGGVGGGEWGAALNPGNSR